MTQVHRFGLTAVIASRSVETDTCVGHSLPNSCRTHFCLQIEFRWHGPKAGDMLESYIPSFIFKALFSSELSGERDSGSCFWGCLSQDGVGVSEISTNMATNDSTRGRKWQQNMLRILFQLESTSQCLRGNRGSQWCSFSRWVITHNAFGCTSTTPSLPPRQIHKATSHQSPTLIGQTSGL